MHASIESLEMRTLLAAIKIMPLGDSITASTTGHDSYRYQLWKTLQNNGYTDIDFVGSLTGVYNGLPVHTDFDMNHEGHWGWRADEINAQISGWANTYRPDIVLMHLGTNDIFQNQSNSSTITDLGSIIDRLRAVNPNVTLIMAQLIPYNGSGSTLTQLNSQIVTLASQKNTSQSRVVTVDQFSGFNAAADTFDGVHPNTTGENKMAAKWYSSLTQFLQVTQNPPGYTYLSDLNPTLATNGWGPYERDRSNGEQGAGDGGLITLNGVTYTKGLGVHAASELRYTLGGQYTQFLAELGVDDEVGNAGSVAFQVWDNLGNKLYDSGTMTGSTATKSITVDVTGKQELRLIVTNGGNNADDDHGDWAKARIYKPQAGGAPVVNAFNGATINEGGTYSANGSFTDSGAGPWTATVNYGDGSGTQALSINSQNKTFSLSHVYADNGAYSILVTISNSSANGTNSASVNVNNVVPTVTMPANGSVNLGSAWSGSGSFSDPGTLDTFTGTVDYGDGSGVQALTLNADKTFSLSRTYASAGAFTITVTIKDKDNGTKSATTTVTVNGSTGGTTVYLSDLNPTFAINGWGPYERDRSNGENGAGDGGVITLNGATYTKGLGVHAASELRYTLNGQYSLFQADIGIDDESGNAGSVNFQVWDNTGKKLYDSGRMTGASATKSISVNVAGKQEVRLIVTNGGDNTFDDHGDWAKARLVPASPLIAIDPEDNTTSSFGNAFAQGNKLIGSIQLIESTDELTI